MSITVGVNSWVTLVEADTHLANKNDVTDWFDLDDAPAKDGATSKESFIVEAFFRLLYNAEYTLTESLTTDSVKYAQIEFALFLFKNYTDYTKREAKFASGIKSFTYSKWKETFADNIKIPYYIHGILIRAGYSAANFIQEVTVE